MVSTVPPPRLGLTETFTDLADLRDRVADEVPAVSARLASLRAQDPTDLAIAVDAVASVPDADAALEEHLTRNPSDREARTLRAARTIHAAWRLRGTAPASDVEPERFALFFAMLGSAERDLLRLCAEDPDDAQAWTLRLSTARGLVLGVSEARRRFDRLHALVPHPVMGQRELLQYLTPKWGGTWEEVDAFVAVVCADAPDGSPEHALVPYAHLTRWADEHRHEGLGYLAAPEVVAAVEAAADRYTAAPCPGRYAWLVADSDFAVALGLAGRRGRAAGHFARLGTAVDSRAWDLARDHHEDLERIRASTIAEARRR